MTDPVEPKTDKKTELYVKTVRNLTDLKHTKHLTDQSSAQLLRRTFTLPIAIGTEKIKAE